ncbi:MAG: ATP-binding cassette domain-containing protein, partial [Candidatus Eisenbacteria bacterium]|nr:ATP-binding cassette domain-containing protein [Candidatus Eisenbacteria bacterium]
ITRERAAGSRVIEVGRDAMPATVRHEVGASGAVGWRVRITPVSATGPLVRVSEPLELVIRATGVTALLGPNGAGKSVLLAALAGLVRPLGVAIERSATTPDSAQPPLLTDQFPERQVFEEHVEAEVVFAARARGMGRAEARTSAATAFERLGYPPEVLLARRTWELSSGEKRLVETVAALIAPASLLLLDEPTGGLDAARRAALAGLVADRAGRGPVVIASQDLAWIRSLGAAETWLGGGWEDRKLEPATIQSLTPPPPDP